MGEPVDQVGDAPAFQRVEPAHARWAALHAGPQKHPGRKVGDAEKGRGVAHAYAT